MFTAKHSDFGLQKCLNKKMKSLFYFLLSVTCVFLVSTAEGQIMKFKKPKKEPAYGLISSGETYYKYFANYAGHNVYRFDSFGRPIIPGAEQEKAKKRKEMAQEARLRQKSRQTNLSVDFLKTKDETTDASIITKPEEKQALDRLRKNKYVRLPYQTTKTAPKKPVKKTRKIIGPYTEDAKAPPPSPIKPAPQMPEEIEEEETEASFFLD